MASLLQRRRSAGGLIDNAGSSLCVLERENSPLWPQMQSSEKGMKLSGSRRRRSGGRLRASMVVVVVVVDILVAGGGGP